MCVCFETVYPYPVYSASKIEIFFIGRVLYWCWAFTIWYSSSDICVFVFQQTDIELQFSTAPFRKEHSAFNFVAPTETMQVELDASQRSSTVPLPASLHDKSSVIEVIGGGFNFSIPNYDNELRIQVNTRFFVLFLIVKFYFGKNAWALKKARSWTRDSFFFLNCFLIGGLKFWACGAERGEGTKALITVNSPQKGPKMLLKIWPSLRS